MTGVTNSGGAGLNLRIVGGNTQPANPVENMVWINTDTAIPHWYIQNDQPASPNEGDVYITVMTSSTVVLQVLRNNGMKLYFGTAYQYLEGTWKTMGGQAYQNGAWIDLQKFVYNTGKYNENFATDISISSSVISGSRTNGDSYISCFTSRSAVSQSGYAYFYFNSAIDLTDVKTIKFTYSASGQDSSERKYKMVVTTGTTASSAYESPTRGTSGLYSNPSASNPATATLDVTALSGNHRIGVAQWTYNGSTTVRIHSVELIS